MKIISLFPLLILAVCSLTVCEARHLEQTLNLNRYSKEGWHYITRFACSVGSCGFHIKLRLKQSVQNLYPDKSNIELHLLVFNTDHTWPQAMDYERITDRAGLAAHNKILEVPVNGSESQEYHWILTQGYKTRVYYFFLADTEDVLKNKTYQKNQKLEIDFIMKNTDGSHTSQEEYGMQSSHLIMALVYVVFFILNLKRAISYYKKEQEVDYPFVLLNSACAIEFIALSFEWIHLLVQDKYGSSPFIINFFSGSFSIFSQLMVTCVLVFIASGWTITYNHLEDVDLIVLVGALTGFFHLLFVMFGQLQEDNPFSTHDYENWAGIVLLVSKICFFGIFVYLLKQTHNSADHNVKKFIVIFGLLGAVYLLTLPITVFIVSTFVELHARHRAIVVSNMILQSLTLLVLSALLTWKKSPYYSVSFKGRSGLPDIISKRK